MFMIGSTKPNWNFRKSLAVSRWAAKSIDKIRQIRILLKDPTKYEESISQLLQLKEPSLWPRRKPSCCAKASAFSQGTCRLSSMSAYVTKPNRWQDSKWWQPSKLDIFQNMLHWIHCRIALLAAKAMTIFGLALVDITCQALHIPFPHPGSQLPGPFKVPVAPTLAHVRRSQHWSGHRPQQLRKHPWRCEKPVIKQSLIARSVEPQPSLGVFNVIHFFQLNQRIDTSAPLWFWTGGHACSTQALNCEIFPGQQCPRSQISPWLRLEQPKSNQHQHQNDWEISLTSLQWPVSYLVFP